LIFDENLQNSLRESLKAMRTGPTIDPSMLNSMRESLKAMRTGPIIDPSMLNSMRESLKAMRTASPFGPFNSFIELGRSLGSLPKNRIDSEVPPNAISQSAERGKEFPSTPNAQSNTQNTIVRPQTGLELLRLAGEASIILAERSPPAESNRITGNIGSNYFDITLPGKRPILGHRHPLTQTADELIDLFGRFGFAVARGPEVEDVRHNFEALNIPPSHPARDPVDNFYISEGTLLRSQTSTVQVRIMESQPPPVRVIAIGRVYRPDEPDETHFPMFHQIEGLMVDKGVTMADLKTVLRLFARSYLGQDVKIRFRPSFFPFTEPSVEVDMLWHGGDRWVEMGGAGMVDPNVFRSVGYDPDEVTGFAFGLGIERLCMRRHGIKDIRWLTQNDARFLEQF
jgi:phenylalanyl-tRNA synthetase alpha chain